LLQRVHRTRVLGIPIALTAKNSLRCGQCGGKRARRWLSTGRQLRRREAERLGGMDCIGSGEEKGIGAG
jgi:hypothetical protein